MAKEVAERPSQALGSGRRAVVATGEGSG